MTVKTTIIAVAGGKGGVGKSFLTANLAAALALRDQSVIAVDLDLGNSNLHTFLGLENRYAGIAEYLRGTVKYSPKELVVETSIPGLGFIAGDARMPFAANITYPQKLKLLRLLKQLESSYVLVDLSAGTGFNTLDLFQAGQHGMLVTTPELPAIMNMLVFVKNLVLRAISVKLKTDRSLMDKINELSNQSVNDPVLTVERFTRELAETHPEMAAAVSEICRRIRPRIVYNMMESTSDTEIFARIDQTLAETLSIECDHFGLIPYDASIRRMSKRPGIFMSESGSSRTALAIEGLANRIIHYWETPIEGSSELLANYAAEILPS